MEVTAMKRKDVYMMVMIHKPRLVGIRVCVGAASICY